MREKNLVRHAKEEKKLSVFEHRVLEEYLDFDERVSNMGMEEISQ
jgi:hypothetical protein